MNNLAHDTFYKSAKTAQTASDIFSSLMGDVNLHCSYKKRDDYEEYIFVGADAANLRRGTTLHLFIRNDGLVELATARNMRVTQSIIAPVGNNDAFKKLENSLRRKLKAMHLTKKGHLATCFDEHGCNNRVVIAEIAPRPISKKILPSELAPYLK